MSRSHERPRQPGPRWGWLPGRSGVWIIAVCTAIGVLATIIAGREPGAVLGAFLVAGTLVAGLAVRTDAAHMIIPVPALAYLAAGLIAGLVHDRAAISTRSALMASALQWIASGFLAMAAATIVAVVLSTARRLRARAHVPPRRTTEQGHYADWG